MAISGRHWYFKEPLKKDRSKVEEDSTNISTLFTTKYNVFKGKQIGCPLVRGCLTDPDALDRLTSLKQLGIPKNVKEDLLVRLPSSVQGLVQRQRYLWY